MQIRRRRALASALITDVKHVKLAQRLPTQSTNVVIPCSLPNGRRRKYKPRPYWPHDCLSIRPKHDQKHLFRNMGNTTLRLEHRAPEGRGTGVRHQKRSYITILGPLSCTACQAASQNHQKCTKMHNFE